MNFGSINIKLPDIFKHINQQFPEFADRFDIDPFIRRMSPENGRAKGNHVEFRVFFKEQTTFQPGVNGFHNRLVPEKPFVRTGGNFSNN
jgi:hypothetical protein